MNKKIFKKLIEDFLSEIDARNSELEAGNLCPTFQVGKNLRDFVRTDFGDEYKLVYSVGSVRLDTIFHLGEKKHLHNASNVDDIKRLANALQYEIIANMRLYENITLDDFYFVYWGYLARLMKNFNFSITYNNEGCVDYVKWYYDKDYQNGNIFSNVCIEFLYNKLFNLKDFRILDINGNKKEINIKNIDYNSMKRITKENLLNFILSVGEKPTVKQITDTYNADFKEDLKKTEDIEDIDEYYKATKEIRSRMISPELMRKYIKEYDLEYMIKTCNHTEKFKNKLNKK